MSNRVKRYVVGKDVCYLDGKSYYRVFDNKLKTFASDGIFGGCYTRKKACQQALEYGEKQLIDTFGENSIYYNAKNKNYVYKNNQNNR